jgi:hypothetical protein
MLLALYLVLSRSIDRSIDGRATRKLACSGRSAFSPREDSIGRRWAQAASPCCCPLRRKPDPCGRWSTQGLGHRLTLSFPVRARARPAACPTGGLPCLLFFAASRSHNSHPCSPPASWGFLNPRIASHRRGGTRTTDPPREPSSPSRRRCRTCTTSRTWKARSHRGAVRPGSLVSAATFENREKVTPSAKVELLALQVNYSMGRT